MSPKKENDETAFPGTPAVAGEPLSEPPARAREHRQALAKRMKSSAPPLGRADRVTLARACPGCGAVLAAGARGRCARCARPQRSGSSRPELDKAEWQKLRRAAKLRDANRCVLCGSTARLSVHHAVTGSSSLEDLVTLCARCHRREHTRRKNLEAGHFFKAERLTPHARSAAISGTFGDKP